MGWVDEDDHGFAAGVVDATSGGDGGASRAWAVDDDWGREGVESVPDARLRASRDEADVFGFCEEEEEGKNITQRRWARRDSQGPAIWEFWVCR